MKNRTFHYVILFVLLTVYHSFVYCRVATGITSVWPCFVSWYFEKKKKKWSQCAQCVQSSLQHHTRPPPPRDEMSDVSASLCYMFYDKTQKEKNIFFVFLLKKRNVELVFSCRKKDGNGMLFHRDFWTINSFFFL